MLPTKQFRRVTTVLILGLASLTGVMTMRPASLSAASYTAGGYTTDAAVSPGSVAAGGTVTVAASVRSDTARSALVDVEVYGPTGAKVHQQAFDQQAFAAGQTRTYSVPWTVPADAATGTYTVKIGIFAPGWGPLAHWNNGAATFAVSTGTVSPTASPAATPAPTPAPSATPAPGGGSAGGLRVRGNRLVDGGGRAVQLYGVNRSGTEYACVQGWGFADGPVDLAAVQAIAGWRGVNVVRVPLNEHCWLGRNGAPAAYSGAAYRQFVADYVARLNGLGLIAMLELHWTGAGATLATGQQAMLNRDHSVEFWRQVASHPAFKGNPLVIFDPHNEPYPDANRDTAEAWRCWRDGGTCAGVPFQAAGMQEIVNTIRAAGADNVIALGGVRYASSLSGWLAHKPADPQDNLIAAWHIYSFVGCTTPSCWDGQAQIGPTARVVPVVAGEFGPDCNDTSFVQTVADYLEANQGAGYLGWTWNLWGQCHDLITAYDGTPSPVWGRWLKDRFAARAAPPSPTPTPTPAPTPTPTASPIASPSPGPSASPTPAGFAEGGFTTRATTSSASVTRGATVTITATVTSSAATSALVDVEVYNPAGVKVHQQAFDRQAFTAGQSRTYTVRWTVPSGAATGAYSVRIGVFNPGWAGLRHWNGSAATFTVR